MPKCPVCKSFDLNSEDLLNKTTERIGSIWWCNGCRYAYPSSEFEEE